MNHMRGGGGGECIEPRFLDFSISWRLVVRFTPRERACHTHWIGGWVDLRSSVHQYGEVKILDPTGTQTPTPQSSSR
jgi:hypothetical protein